MNDPPLTDGLLLDLDRVEVVRGPQGSLFGQNTDAGAISLITRAPGEQPSAQGLMQIDDRGERHTAYALDVPLVDDRLLMRVSANFAQSRGLTTNLFDGDKPDAFDEDGGRLRLLWRIAPGLRADFAADTSYFSDGFPTGQALTNTIGNAPNGLPPFTVDINTPQVDQRRSSGVSSTLNWDNSLGTLTSISAWREARRHWLADLDYSPLDADTLDYVDRYQRLSQELRLSSRASDSPWTWITGLYAFRQISESDRPTIAGPQIGVFIPSLKQGDVLNALPDVDTRSVAAFGSLGYALRPDLRLDAGLRLVTVYRRLNYTQQASPDYQKLGYLSIDGIEEKSSENALLPDLALSWDLSPSVTSYARYARGSKSGGFNADVLGSRLTQPETFSDETANTYELGVKSHWLQRRLTANLALFLSDYRDYQVSQFQPVGNVVVPTISNAGKVRTYGPELELVARPLRGLTLSSSAAWLHAEYDEFLNGGGAGINYSGNRTEYSPRWSVDSTVEYHQPLQ
jgi:iron complex outermembrane receptor protein